MCHPGHAGSADVEVPRLTAVLGLSTYRLGRPEVAVPIKVHLVLFTLLLLVASLFAVPLLTVLVYIYLTLVLIFHGLKVPFAPAP